MQGVLPLESALKDLPGLASLDDVTRDGAAFLRLSFPASPSDLLAAVRDRVAAAALPPNVQVEVFLDAGPTATLYVVLRRDGTIADLVAPTEAVGEALARVAGVRRVDPIGAPTPEVEVVVSPERLAARGLAWARVLDALSLVPTGPTEPLASPEALGDVVVAPDVRVRDVAEVRTALATDDGWVRLANGPAVLFAVHVSEAVRVARVGVARALDAFRRSSPVPGVDLALLDRWDEVRLAFPAGTSRERALEAARRAVAETASDRAQPIVIVEDGKDEEPLAGTFARVLLGPADPTATGDLVRAMTAAVPSAAVSAADDLRTAPAIRFTGDDRSVLEAQMARAEAQVREAVPTARFTRAGLDVAPSPSWRFDADRLRALGLEERDVRRLLEAAGDGLVLLATCRVDGRARRVRVRYGQGARSPLERTSLPVGVRDGRSVPLGEVASARLSLRPRVLTRHQGRPCATLRFAPPDPPTRARLAWVVDALAHAAPAGVEVELVGADPGR